jgi:hypothetical protein
MLMSMTTRLLDYYFRLNYHSAVFHNVVELNIAYASSERGMKEAILMNLACSILIYTIRGPQQTAVI